jgi:glycosyltransferase involved in cell wall biosynthesis
VDDGSEDFDTLRAHLNAEEKVRLFHNAQNRGVFGNKLEAIAQCRHSWVINCDSDNYMGLPYLDLAASLAKDPRTWYCPSFAKPEFDYRELVGRWHLANIEELLEKPLAECALNTGNQIVHRKSFMKVFGGYRGRRFDLLQPNYLELPTSERTTHRHRLVYDAKDSLIFNMEWLFAGGTLEIVPGLEYDHYYTSGPESNYARAPEEKDKLNDILIATLRERSREERINKIKRGQYE